MKDFPNWLHHHPIKACGFTCWFTMAACLFANEAVNWRIGVIMFSCGLMWWVFFYCRDTEKDWDIDDTEERNM